LCGVDKDDLSAVERGFHVEAVARVGEHALEHRIGEDAVQAPEYLFAGLVKGFVLEFVFKETPGGSRQLVDVLLKGCRVFEQLSQRLNGGIGNGEDEAG